MAKGLRDLIQEAKSQVEEISAEEAAGLHGGGQDVLFLDVREVPELGGGRVLGAIHVSRGLLEPKAASDSPMQEAALSNADRIIVAYCASGVRSVLAAVTLQTLGFTQVKSLTGGFQAWKDAGHPVDD